MTTLRFHARPFPFAALPQFGQDDSFARLASPDAIRAGFPLWTWEQADRVSRWFHVDRNASLQAVSQQNPGQAELPSDARFVVAGQQVGLLTGPLYTFLKAVSAIGLTREIRKRTNLAVFPLFWMASEDHDVLEVNRVRVNGRQFVHEYKGELRHGAVPQVADISIADAREPLLEFLEETLPSTEFTEWVLDAVAMADFSSYATAFRDLMRWMFSDWNLRVVDPVALRPLTAPALAALVERWPETTTALGRGAQPLRDAGFTPPLDSPGIFEIANGNRLAVVFSGNSARIASGEIGFRELAEEILRRPLDFSPNAALRPVLQDAALPVAITLGGPSELLYLWQIDPIYGVPGVTRSLLRPRISATFIESKIQRIAEKVGLWPDRIFEVRRELQSATYLSLTQGDTVSELVESKAKALLDAIDVFLSAGEAPWLAKGRERLAGQIDKIMSKLREERSEEAKLAKSRLEKMVEAILPENKPQERVANPFEYLNLYGKGFVRLSIESLDPLSNDHQVAHIFTESEEEKPDGN